MTITIKVGALASFLALAAAPSAAHAYDSPFCTSVIPEECSDTTLSARVNHNNTGWSNEVSGAQRGSVINGEIFINVREEGIQGFSYSLYSDDTSLLLSNVTDGNATSSILSADFNVTVPAVQDGIVQAIVLSFTAPLFMPIQSGQRLLNMQYTVSALGTNGTWISFVNKVLRSNAASPPVTTVFTKHGTSIFPRKVLDAIIR